MKLRLRRCKKVGVDEYENQYFVDKKTGSRFCLYYGIPEASKVPAEWHAWLHNASSEIPTNQKKFNWQINHIPNSSGTKFAYTQLNSIRSAISNGVFLVVKKYKSWM
ncbi:NADH-ubiquinone oxidoreductase subunit NDUFA12 family protein [Candidatus Deianiraea vastatrix]|nr:NADH-ubiquinone oxidoreductase subunit NDUFA12 family protein [Candidatus Deianiraea vastatrix]